MTTQAKYRTLYLLFDVLSAAGAWFLFNLFRKTVIEPAIFGYEIPVTFSLRFFQGLGVLVVFWLLIYYISGYYRDILRKARLLDLWQTFLSSLFGITALFFLFVLDDYIRSYEDYYRLFLVWFGLHFGLTLLPRLLLTSSVLRKLSRRHLGFNTLLIGSGTKALGVFEKLDSLAESTGNRFVGFVTVRKEVNETLAAQLRHLGDFDELLTIVKQYAIEEVIIAIESGEHEDVKRIINRLKATDVIIKVIADVYNVIRGRFNMTFLEIPTLIVIGHDLMPPWQQNIKRLLDVLVSIFAMLVLAPIYLIVGVGVKLTSRGPVFYSHERVGRHGRPFTIYKFRSMYVGAERNGPALASVGDSRITRLGRFLRKTRLDEIPQFFNVLRGDMSLVGPRPERQFFIDQIVQRTPEYLYLQRVRPGMTSLGQVKYGYAENVDQMVERLNFDIIYLENMSLYTDIKILIYTVLVVLMGRGK